MRHLHTAALALPILISSTYVAAQSGMLDPSFADGGVFTETWGNPDYVFSEIKDLVVQPDGRIVLVGYVQDLGTTRAAIVRLTADGQFDTSFSFDGRVMPVIDGLNDRAVKVALLPDGRIVVAGTSFAGGVQPGWVAVYNTDGTLHVGFGENGILRLSVPGVPFRIGALRVTASGHITLAGIVGSTLTLMRFDDQGVADPSFSFDGVVSNAAVGSAYGATALVEQPDGRLIVLANIESGPSANCALRYGTDGTLDLSFGENGVAAGYDELDLFSLQALLLLPDGRTLITGANHDTSTAGLPLVMLTAQGQPDGAFGTNGVRHITTPSGLSNGYGMALLPSGQVLIAAPWHDGVATRAGVLRLGLQLEPDTGFGSDGMAQCPIYPEISASAGYHLFLAVGVQPDGRIVAAGYAGFDAQDFWSAARFTNDGNVHVSEVPAASGTGISVLVDPGADLVHITLGEARAGRHHIRLYDAHGAVVRDGGVLDLHADGHTLPPLPLHGLPNGPYIISAEGPTTTRSRPFIICHH